MPLYFIGFLAMLGAALLLYVAALATSGITRRPPPLIIDGRAADALQAVHLALAWSSVGVGWLLYFNVYRLHVDMAAVSEVALQAFSRGYTRRLAVVVLPYGAGALAAALSLWAAPGRFSRRALWGIASLWVLSVATTPWAAGAQGDMQEHGFSDAAFQQLQMAHLARTLCLSVAAVWSLWLGWYPRRAST
ncbi:hypothetical protein [Mitsuaria sp. 7]|uniref:hypothetical protein n=1 Tax=Mitsuaria sp. 7 TaxID=1658665 RepID=UPI0007DD95A6|nr:hypothetical protein [Mitsuaria sp. 7]ANH69770.1 hypothetical protein ABE85_23235 [Mitsuaria sp. 7]